MESNPNRGLAMIKSLRFIVLCLIMSPLFMISSNVSASQCKGHFVNPITDICWDCLFPLTIGSKDVVKGGYPDTDNPEKYTCECLTDGLPRIGLTLGYWEPFALVDVTRKPFCMVNLGVQLDISSLGLGASQMTSIDGDGAFYYVHWYKYPLMYWLNILASVACVQPDGFDVMFLSELDITWNDSELAFIFNPEATLFTHPVIRASCALDATSAIAGTAMDKMFWCQGAQGSTYPLTGFVSNQSSPISAAILLAERADFKLHRVGAILDSVGKDAPAICMPYYSALLPKSRYRYQMTNTIPEAARCHPFGHTAVTWEAGHTVPGDGDNFGFMIWRKRNCCFL